MGVRWRRLQPMVPKASIPWMPMAWLKRSLHCCPNHLSENDGINVHLNAPQNFHGAKLRSKLWRFTRRSTTPYAIETRSQLKARLLLPHCVIKIPVDSITMPPSFDTQPHKISKWLKRAIDVGCSLVLILILSPVLLAITLLVLAIDGLPVIYRRRVVGPQGAFNAFKFRTMRRDADILLERDESLRAAFTENFKLKTDPRVTRLGSFLRKLSLDELPQLFNVLAGQMSLVGPRMITAPELEKYG